MRTRLHTINLLYFYLVIVLSCLQTSSCTFTTCSQTDICSCSKSFKQKPNETSCYKVSTEVQSDHWLIFGYLAQIQTWPAEFIWEEKHALIQQSYIISKVVILVVVKQQWRAKAQAEPCVLPLHAIDFLFLMKKKSNNFTALNMFTFKTAVVAALLIWETWSGNSNVVPGLLRSSHPYFEVGWANHRAPRWSQRAQNSTLASGRFGYLMFSIKKNTSMEMLQRNYSVCGGIQPAQLVCTVVKLI